MKKSSPHYKLDTLPKFPDSSERYLGLDLGTNLGWAFVDTHLRGLSVDILPVTCGMLKLKEKEKEVWAARFVRLTNFLDKVKPTAVFYELVRQQFKSNKASLCYGGFLATTEVWCLQHNIPCHALDVGTIKKFATGSGNADKVAMIKAANQKFALQLDPKKPDRDSDIADATHVLAHGMKLVYDLQIFPTLQPLTGV